jgi:hypothetical protein
VIFAFLALLSMRGTVPALVTPEGFSAQEPQVASVGRQVFVACGAGDRLYVLGSEDGGKTFGAPVALPAAGKLALGMRRGPRIAVAGKEVVVSAVYGKAGGGKDGDLLAWRSADGGKVWQGPVAVNDVPGAAREGLHAMAASPGGKLACVWLDLREGKTEIWESVSSDQGRSWSKNLRVYRSPDGTICECCHPSVAFGPKGEMYVMFRNWLGGARDMYLAKSTTDGKSFEPAQKLGRGTWPLNACPMDGGAIAIGPSGDVTTVWRRAGHVYLCRPGQDEVDLGEGRQPWATCSVSGIRAVWLREGQVAGIGGPAKPTPGPGKNPVMCTLGGRAVAFWADDSGRIWSADFDK